MRWQRGGPNTPYGAWDYPSAWQDTTSTAKTLTGMAAGYTYCFSVRVRDKADNISAWSQPLCTAKMFDDRSFTATPSWTAPERQGRLLRQAPTAGAPPTARS